MVASGGFSEKSRFWEVFQLAHRTCSFILYLSLLFPKHIVPVKVCSERNALFKGQVLLNRCKMHHFKRLAPLVAPNARTAIDRGVLFQLRPL